jgi:hypothetical protein
LSWPVTTHSTPSVQPFTMSATLQSLQSRITDHPPRSKICDPSKHWYPQKSPPYFQDLRQRQRQILMTLFYLFQSPYRIFGIVFYFLESRVDRVSTPRGRKSRSRDIEGIPAWSSTRDWLDRLQDVSCSLLRGSLWISFLLGEYRDFLWLNCDSHDTSGDTKRSLSVRDPS